LVGDRSPLRCVRESQRTVDRRPVPSLAESRGMNLEALVLGVFSGLRPGTSLAAVLVLLKTSQPSGYCSSSPPQVLSRAGRSGW
jgi:hypothetical protein